MASKSLGGESCERIYPKSECQWHGIGSGAKDSHLGVQRKEETANYLRNPQDCKEGGSWLSSEREVPPAIGWFV